MRSVVQFSKAEVLLHELTDNVDQTKEFLKTPTYLGCFKAF